MKLPLKMYYCSMAGNSFGEIFRITTFGESHGTAIGVVIDGCPAGLIIDVAKIQHELDRRRPGQSALTTSRNEHDRVQLLSGVYLDKTTGSPIALLIANQDAKPEDYELLRDAYRPSHADYTYEKKYGHRDHRGGGRSSARETAARVAAGAVAKLLLAHHGVSIHAYVTSVGTIETTQHYSTLDFSQIESNPVRCPDTIAAKSMIAEIEAACANGDTLGGIITCVASKVPVGLGEPVFDKLHADLGKAMLSINAVHGFEYGSGFAGTRMFGSHHNDVPLPNAQGTYQSAKNHSGGIQGGISNGEDIYFRVAFKPVATIMQQTTTINKMGETITLPARGRHDPCVLPRAVPIVEAMTALVLADHLLRHRASKI